MSAEAKCIQCGGEFTQRWPDQKTCSEKCIQSAMRAATLRWARHAENKDRQYECPYGCGKQIDYHQSDCCAGEILWANCGLTESPVTEAEAECLATAGARYER